MNPAVYNGSRYWAVPTSLILRFNLTSPNNLPLTYYDNYTYGLQELFKQIYWYSEVVSYGVLLMGIVCDKVIGVELFLAWQTAYFAIASIDKIHPLLRPLAEMKTLNGINNFMQTPNDDLPERIQAISYSGEFLSNCSYTGWLPAADLILCALVYIISFATGRFKEKVQDFGGKLLREYFMMLVSFNALNYAYSAGLQLIYGKEMPLYNYLALGGSLAMVVIAVGLLIGGKEELFGEFVLNFKSTNVLTRHYFVIATLYRLILGGCMSLLNNIE